MKKHAYDVLSWTATNLWETNLLKPHMFLPYPFVQSKVV